jgi:putative RecB family exonuclease
MNRANGLGQEENYVQNRPNILEISGGAQHFEEENPQAQEATKPHGKSFVWQEGEKMKERVQEKPHLSYSQINCYMTCPLKYRFHYIDQIEPPFVSSALAFGSCIHEAVGAFYQSFLEGESLSAGQIHDVYRQAWESHSKERPIRFFNGDTGETLTTKAQRMLEVFQESFDPTVQIIGIEEPFEVDLGKRIPPLVGWIDAVEQAPDGTVSVVDLKTASKRYSDNTVHSNVQLTCYSLGAKVLGFNGDTRFRLDVILKTQNPELIRYETTRNDADRERFLKLVKTVWQGIKKEVFFPKADWQCGQCPFLDHCKSW